MLLFLLLAAVEPGSAGVEIPPATDPTGRIIAVAVAFLAVVGPYATAKVSAKKGAINGPAPIGDHAATASLDVGQQYLERYVKGLEDNVKSVEAENVILRKQVLELVEDRAMFKAQNEALRADIAGLRDEIHELRGQLRGRGDGR
jgi:hypothetical protein